MAPPEKPIIDTSDIQGDIWPGLMSKCRIYYFFKIVDVPRFKTALRQCLEDGKIVTAAGAEAQRQTIKGIKEAGDKSQKPLSAVNVSFTYPGLQKWKEHHPASCIDPANLIAGHYKAGMKGDMLTEGRDREEDWDPAFLARPDLHGVFIIAGTADQVMSEKRDLEKRFESTIENRCVLVGDDLKGDDHGKEHFGFKDSISQPQIDGLDPPPRNKEPPAVRPGIILTGNMYEDRDEDPEQPGWTKNGSFMAFRKLRQLVPEWDTLVVTKARELNYTPDQMGARLVGRWQSGAPVDKTPYVDDPSLANDNDFDFGPDLHSQLKCPFAAHIRKTRPRADGPNHEESAPGKNDIIRRGIPYGPPPLESERATGKTQYDRGLLFTCYQSNIGNGFSFLFKDWINPNTFPVEKSVQPGADPIATQNLKVRGKGNELFMNLVDINGRPKKISFENTVIAGGGEYFFSPSITCLKQMATESHS